MVFTVQGHKFVKTFDYLVRSALLILAFDMGDNLYGFIRFWFSFLQKLLVNGYSHLSVNGSDPIPS